jgi:hypothetical protein
MSSIPVHHLPNIHDLWQALQSPTEHHQRIGLITHYCAGYNPAELQALWKACTTASVRATEAQHIVIEAQRAVGHVPTWDACVSHVGSPLLAACLVLQQPELFVQCFRFPLRHIEIANALENTEVLHAIGIAAPRPFLPLPAIHMASVLHTMGEPQWWMQQSRPAGNRAQIVIQQNATSVWAEQGRYGKGLSKRFSTLESYLPDTVLSVVIEAPFVTVVNIIEFRGQATKDYSRDRHMQLWNRAIGLIPDAVAHQLCLRWNNHEPLQSWQDVRGNVVLTKWGQTPPLTISGHVYVPHHALRFRACLMYSDTAGHYTFGVDHQGGLVPVARLHVSALPKHILAPLKVFLAANKLERKGPVTTVLPGFLLQIETQGIVVSPRTKAGITVLSPQAVGITQHPAEQPETVDSLSTLLEYAPMQSS